MQSWKGERFMQRVPQAARARENSCGVIGGHSASGALGW